MKGEVYSQSICLMNQVVYHYYIKRETLAVISKQLNVSQSTISRLLKRAEIEDVVSVHIDSQFMSCIDLEQTLKKKYNLKDVQILPIHDSLIDSSSLKKRVGLEGARYLQRIITDNDIIGIAWGETMYDLVQYLNPCRKKAAKIVTLHGSIANSSSALDVEKLVRRSTMAFGGKRISLRRQGLLSQKEMALLKESEYYKNIQDVFSKIDISVTSVGAIRPKTTSLLGTSKHLSPEELKEIVNEKAICDIMMRYINEEGQECQTSMRDRTYSISLESYRQIPIKILVASGPEKVESVRALNKGKLFDVLIADMSLASLL